MKTTKQGKITIERGKPHRGVRAAARALGCSGTHLHFVLRGERKPGKALAAKLDRAGITYPNKRRRP